MKNLSYKSGRSGKLVAAATAAVMIGAFFATPAFADLPPEVYFCREHAAGFCQSPIDNGVRGPETYQACYDAEYANCIDQLTRDGWGAPAMGDSTLSARDD